MAHNTDNSNDLEKIQTDDSGSNSAAVSKSNSAVYDKSQSLVDIANNTFKELCRTLENEQSKLLELEERRKKLQEEMQRLKLEIEEEKHTYRLNLVEALTDNAEAMCAKDLTSLENDSNMETEEDSSSEFQKDLYTCYEAEETPNRGELSPDSDSGGENNKRPNDVAESIQRKLQGVVAECVIEQCNYEDPPHETEKMKDNLY